MALCQAALESPANLGEAKHLLANDSDVRYVLGCALAAAGRQVGRVAGQVSLVGGVHASHARWLPALICCGMMC